MIKKLTILLLLSLSYSATLLVPDEYSTIQSAIDAASDGDTVLVSAGTYYENITWAATNGIKLIGSGENDCFIDGNELGSVIRFEGDGNIDSTTLITGFIIQDGYAQGDHPYHYGGGMYIEDSSPTLIDVTFSGNSAYDGGGIYFEASNSNLLNVTINANIANQNGAGLCINNSELEINNSHIDSNMSEQRGGGIFSGYSYINITNTQFNNNISRARGGGIYISHYSANFDNVEISGNSLTNHGTNHGAGIYCRNANLYLSNSTISNNNSNYGAGLAIEYDVQAYLENVIFSDNSPTFLDMGQRGMGIYCRESSLSANQILFYNNTTDDCCNGGNINRGSGMYFWEADSVLLNNITLSGTNTEEGGAIEFYNSNYLSINNSILWGNSPSQLFLNSSEDYGMPTAFITFSDFEGGFEGGGNIDADPLFTDPDNGDYTLQPSSPCIDTGDPESEYDPDGTRADMGAYYYHQEQDVEGCTNPEASNYNPDATVDDGTCEYDDCNTFNNSNDQNGCMESPNCYWDGWFEYCIDHDFDWDTFDCSFEALDNQEICINVGCAWMNGSCMQPMAGCTSVDACNYNPNATGDDGSCEYFDECGICDGDGIADGVCDCEGNMEDCAGECGGDAILDCENTCNGDAILDCEGTCGGDAVLDCENTCGGDAILDCENTCNGDAILDCEGTCGGSAVFDQCGVCNGDGTSCIIYGCMDENACNHVADANVDDGSCTYAEENFDCAGNCIVELDCAGACGGSAVFDQCGDCDDDSSNDCYFFPVTDGCDLPDDPSQGSLHLTDDGKVLYNSPQPIAGFEFKVDGAEVLSVLGGDAVDAGLTVMISPSNSSYVLGFSMMGQTTSEFPGCGTLVELELAGNALGLFDLVVSNVDANLILFEYTPGVLAVEGCMDVNACNHVEDAEEEVNVDDGSCEYLDCYGECGGSSIIDCAGTCDGDWVFDACEICGGSGPEQHFDCEGNCLETLDQCGTCDDDASNDCVQDECGIWGGGGIANGTCDCDGNVVDGCGVCDGMDDVDCFGDCNATFSEGTWLNQNPGAFNGQIPLLSGSADDGSWNLSTCMYVGGDDIINDDGTITVTSMYDAADVYACSFSSADYNGVVTMIMISIHDPSNYAVIGEISFEMVGNNFSSLGMGTFTGMTGDGSLTGNLAGGSSGGAVVDCEGTCDGVVEVDECGVCHGDGFLESCLDGSCQNMDCFGVCGGIAEVDECGECEGNGYDMCDDDGNGMINLEQWGYGAHSVYVTDVPEDQGSRVYLDFQKSFYDTDTLRSTESYQIERLDDEQWVAVATQNAYGNLTYMVEATTLSNNDTTQFRIIASMDEGNFICLENGFGESIDNIHPAIPTGLMATVSDGSAMLSWNEPVDADFQYFTIFRNGELLDYTIESTYVDYAYGELEYYMTATDANDNESGQSESIMLDVEPLAGDVNYDGILNVQDVILIVNCALEEGQGFGCYDELADLNSDGIINILDIVILVNIILEN